jgi:predicted permease
MLGLLVAFAADRYLLTLMGHSKATSLSVRPDSSVLCFTLLVSLLTSLLCGFLPAWRATRLDPTSALVASIRSVGSGGARSSLSRVFIVSQVALSLVLLTGATLLVRTLENLENFDPGFNKERVLLFTVNPGVIGYNFDQSSRLYQRLLDKINEIPGVRGATFSFYSPLNMLGRTLPKFEESTPSIQGSVHIGINELGPNYFKTFETSMLAGRDFTTGDRAGTHKVAIINEEMARRFFAGTNPIGKHLTVPGWNGDASWKEIVGIVKDTKNRDLRELPTPMIYLPLFQFPDEGLLTFEIRTASNPLSIANDIRRLTRTAEPRLPVFDIKTLDEQVDDSLLQARLIALLSGLFAGLALLLAAVGLYGLMTYSMNRRTGEIGIRIALGATRGQIAGMVLGETLLLVGLGIAIGGPAAIVSSQLIKSELYGLSANDPLTICMVSLMMAGIAALAAYLPAKRASQVDPMVALRAQ